MFTDSRTRKGRGEPPPPPPRPRARRRGIPILRVLMAVLLVIGITPGTGVADDPGRYKTTPTGWGWYTGAAEPTITGFINEFGQRLIDIEVVKKDGPKFASALVANSGAYNSPSWHWYFGLTFNQLVDLDPITSGRERVLDVENYKVGSSRRYAVVTVNNQGENAKAWWWYLNVSKSFIKSKLEGKRIVDLDPRPGSSKYDVVMIRNKGEDQKAWWYYYKRTPAQIKSLLKSNKGRLVDIERDGSGRFTIVMVRRAGEYWWWYYGLKTSKVAALTAQNGARIIDIERYQTSNGPRHAVVMLNNLNALSRKAWKLMQPGVQKGVAYGFYLKEVGGPVYAALQENLRFEPASTIKVLHLLHAMRAVQAGNASLTELITWFVRPSDPARNPGDTDYSNDKNKCAYQNDGTAITSNPYVDPLGEVILRQMMEQSDNRTTDATLNRFGMAAINQTADLVGMTRTEVNHRIGCPHKASPQPYERNELTLHDAGLLYEGVADGTQLGTGTLRDTFYDYMLNGVSGWKDIVDAEAAKLGLSQAVADEFLDNMRTAVKGGSYTNGATCPSGTSGVCQLLRRTGFGVLTLPFKVSATGGVVEKHFVYGSFVDGTFKCGSSCDGEITKIGDARSKAQQAIMRPRIRAALETW